MTQDELKTKIEESLLRNAEILIAEVAPTLPTPKDLRDLMRACAANLAQTIPEMFATVVLNETVAAAVRRVREQEREACAAKLDAMADEISEESASRAQQLRAAAEAVRKQGA